MKRSVSEARIGPTQVRFRVHIEDYPSLPGHQAGWRLVEFLAALTQSPDLLNCGFSKPEKLTFSHTGQCWIAEGEALAEEDQ